LLFTRFANDGTALYRSSRSRVDAPFAAPQRISGIDGPLVEAPTLSPDERAIYLHKQTGERFANFRAQRRSMSRRRHVCVGKLGAPRIPSIRTSLGEKMQSDLKRLQARIFNCIMVRSGGGHQCAGLEAIDQGHHGCRVL